MGQPSSQSQVDDAEEGKKLRNEEGSEKGGRKWEEIERILKPR